MSQNNAMRFIGKLSDFNVVGIVEKDSSESCTNKRCIMKLVMKDTSLDSRIQEIRDAVYKKLNPYSAHNTIDIEQHWVQEVYLGYVIVKKGQQYFQVPYSYDELGNIVIGELVPVEQAWIGKEFAKRFKKRGNIKGLGKHLAKKYGPSDEGFFTRCMAAEELSNYDEETRKAVCARAKKEQIGHWPGDKPPFNESKKSCCGRHVKIVRK